MTLKTKGIVYLLIATVLYSIMPILIRFVGNGNIPPVSQVFLRYTVACFAAIIYFRVTKSKFSVKRKDILLLFFVALFGYALVNVFFTYANLYTQIGTVLFIFNCSTVMGPLLGYIFLKERLSPAIITATIIGFFSLFFLFSPGPMETWKLGALFALASAFGSSLYVIGRKKLNQYDSSIILLSNTVVGVVCVGILAVCMELPFYAGGGFESVSATTWLTIFLFGLDNFAAYLCMTKGFQLLSAGEGSMIMLSENVIGISLAFMFLGEIPTVQSLIGGGLILIASYLVIHTQLIKQTR